MLWVAQQDVASLRANASASAVELATVTGSLTTANQKIGQLEGEVLELPKVKAELAAAQSQLKEEAALIAKAGGELVELQSQQVAAATQLAAVQEELATRAKQEEITREEL